MGQTVVPGKAHSEDHYAAKTSLLAGGLVTQPYSQGQGGGRQEKGPSLTFLKGGHSGRMKGERWGEGSGDGDALDKSPGPGFPSQHCCTEGQPTVPSDTSSHSPGCRFI